MTDTLSATEWARANGEHFAGYLALDNYEPTRSFERIECYRYDLGDDPRGSGYVLDGAFDLRNATEAVYLMDDGHTVAAHYVAGYHHEHRYIILHAFPTNWNADGTPVMRADRDVQVSYDNWQLGPRRAYHVKLRAVTA